MKRYIHEIPDFNYRDIEERDYDVVIVGGGMSGVCAAMASARYGAKTAIVQDRSVFGGNASSEIRMHIAGASCHWGKENAAETGILLELQLENKRLNFNHNYSIWDGILWSKLKEEKNLDIFLNTVMFDVESNGKRIDRIYCYQSTTEKEYELSAKIFVDASGNATLGYYAGAEYRIGSESKEEFQEADAKDSNNGDTMGNSIMFCARDTGKPVKFIKPEWAFTFSESDLKYRYHGKSTVYHDEDKVVLLSDKDSYEDHKDELVEKYDVQSGYWWIELGGNYSDIIKQSEDIRYDLYRCVYGVWDHIKNGGDHGAENYELVWVGNQSGIRESRRLEGAYTLTENDVLNNRIFSDGVAYGGWPMDEHTPGGIRAKEKIPSVVRSFDGLYSIPLRCYCSKNITNLMMAGRNISASKLAMGSTRVMGTCSVGGQAVGTAAAIAAARHCFPIEVVQNYIKILRQELIKNDCYIPGCSNEDNTDLARLTTVTASSFKKNAVPENVINGVTRTISDESNLWCSDGFSSDGEFILLNLKMPQLIHQVRLTFDPNLSEEHCISISKAFIEKIPVGVPKELIKDYIVKLYNHGKLVYQEKVTDNYQRLNVINIDPVIEADELKIHILSTNGCPDARLFEVRLY